MPTARLTTVDKNRITAHLSNVIARTKYSVDFPYPYKKEPTPPVFYSLIESCVPPEALEAYNKLRYDLKMEQAVKTTRNIIMHIDDLQNVRSDNSFFRYSFSFSVHKAVFPMGGYLIDVPNPHYTAIIKWCREVAQIHDDANSAIGYIEDVIEACTTAGQIKRCLPNIVPFLSEGLRASFNDAERRSRVPSLIILKPELERNAYRMLGLGAMMEEPSFDAKYNSVDYNSRSALDFNKHYGRNFPAHLTSE